MELSINDLKEILGEGAKIGCGLPSGEAVIIRTVTHYYTGKVISHDAKWIVLTDAAWIPDTGRWHDALTKGTLNEVEPYPDGPVWVNRDAIIDMARWDHPLPRAQK